MHAVRCRNRGIELVEVPSPSGEGVRVRVRSVGICGSDLHLVSSGFADERTLGHEIAGELDDGTPVAVEPIAPCGHCEPCVRGDYNLCRLGPSTVMGVGRDGGMAQELRVPRRALVALPKGLPTRDACLVEPLAVAVHGLRIARFRGGQRVAVVGAGSIGLCALAAAGSAGGEVALVARHERQREAGARLGAREIDGEYDLVVEAAGTQSALEQAALLCKPGGTLLLLATYWSGISLPGFLVSMKEIRIVPASMYGREGAIRDIDVASALLAGQPAIAETMITHRFPLDAAVEAFETAASRSAGAIKVVLEP